MNHNQFDGTGVTIVTFLSATFAWISLAEGQIILTMMVSLTGIITGVLASVYWYKKTKKLKK